MSDTPPLSPPTAISRRALLAAAGGAAGASLVTRIPAADAAQAAAQPPAAAPEPLDTTRVPGPGPSPLGTRSPFEQSQRRVGGVSLGTPHQDLHGIITPSDLHFERHHAGVPTVDPAAYTLLIHGLVDRPLVFTLADLKRLPSVSAPTSPSAPATSLSMRRKRSRRSRSRR